MRISRLQDDRGHVKDFDAYDVLLQGRVVGNALHPDTRPALTWRIGPVLVADEEAGSILAYVTHGTEGSFVTRRACDKPELVSHRMMDARCEFRVFLFEGLVEIRRKHPEFALA